MTWIRLLALFIKEIVLSGLQVAWLVVQPNLKLQPGFVAYPLTATSDAQIALLSNLITLTPGTLSVDVSDDRKILFIHALNVSEREALIGHIAAGFETQVLRALR